MRAQLKYELKYGAVMPSWNSSVEQRVYFVVVELKYGTTIPTTRNSSMGAYTMNDHAHPLAYDILVELKYGTTSPNSRKAQRDLLNSSMEHRVYVVIVDIKWNDNANDAELEYGAVMLILSRVPSRVRRIRSTQGWNNVAELKYGTTRPLELKYGALMPSLNSSVAQRVHFVIVELKYGTTIPTTRNASMEP